MRRHDRDSESDAVSRGLPPAVPKRAVLWAAIAWAALAASAQPAPAVEAITKPSGDVKLSFIRPGLIGRVLVKEGQAVEAGEVLLEQDDSAERVQMEEAKAQAEDVTKIDYAKAQLEQKKVYLRRIKEAGPQATTPTEIEVAELDVKVAELSLQLARFEHTQEQRKYREAEAQIERMRIRSPIAGKVEQITVKEGEASDALAAVIRVVSVAPLWIDVPVELAVARGLSAGSPTQVDFAACALADGTTSAPAMSVEGRITYIGAVAEAASNTLLVRVEAPNPSGRPAGERVAVTFRRGTGGPGAAKASPAATTQPHSSSSDTNNKKE